MNEAKLSFLFVFLVTGAARAAAPYDSISIQGYMKTTGGVPVDGTFNGRVTLYQNSAPCWNSGVALIPVTFANGAFVKTLSGGVSSGLCTGTLGSAQFGVPGPFTWTLALDMDADNTVDTTFSNIPVTPVPLAMAAESVTGAVQAAQITGTINASMIGGGAFGAIDSANLVNLNATALVSGTVAPARLGSGTPSATTYLRGDGSWSTISGVGEANTASNVGTGAGVFAAKTGVDLSFRSILGGSGKVSVIQGTNEVTVDVNEPAMVLGNIGGTLSGSKVTGGTFGAVNASNLTNINAGSLTTGLVSPARLGSGTASAATFLRGDGSWQAPPSTGEANTASNQGTGAGVFKQKTAMDLEFRSLLPGSTKVSVSQNVDDVTVDVVESALTLGNMGGTLSGTKVSGGTFGAVNASALTNLNGGNITIGQVPAARLGTGVADATTFLRGDGTWASPGAAGEANTVTNLGSGGRVFKQKVGVDFELRSVLAGSSKLTVAENLNDLTVDITEANINLANLGGTLSGSKVTGGTFGAVNGSALTNLNATSLVSGTVAAARLGTGIPSASTYLRGDGTWATVSGEANSAVNIGTGAQIFKQKTGLDVELRSLVATSTRVAVAQNLNDVSIDVTESNLNLANMGGTLSGTKVSGGTFGAVNGSALTNLNASNIATGTAAEAVLPVASASNGGIINTAAQTLAGAKTFNGAITLASLLTLSSADVATAATINCLASTTSIVRLTGTTATAINGISPGVNGQILIVYTDGNIGTSLTIANNNASGCANGKIITNMAANVISTTASSTAAFVFVYNGPSLRWHMIASTP